MTSVTLAFELHFKSESLTSGTLAVLALGFILLLAWKYRKSLKHFFGYGKRTISFQSGNRKPVPEENEETNCSQRPALSYNISKEAPRNISQDGVSFQGTSRRQCLFLMASSRSSVPIQEIRIDNDSQQNIWRIPVHRYWKNLSSDHTEATIHAATLLMDA